MECHVRGLESAVSEEKWYHLVTNGGDLDRVYNNVILLRTGAAYTKDEAPFPIQAADRPVTSCSLQLL